MSPTPRAPRLEPRAASTRFWSRVSRLIFSPSCFAILPTSSRGEETPLTRLGRRRCSPERRGARARLKKPAAADVSRTPSTTSRARRRGHVLLLVEIPDCEWCAATRPAFRQLAKSRASTDPRATRVCAFEAKTPEDRQWAHKHLAAHSFPTVIALPRRGGVYKYGGGTASVRSSPRSPTRRSPPRTPPARPPVSPPPALSPRLPRRRSRGAFSLRRSLAASVGRPPGSSAWPRTRSRRTRWSPRASPCSCRRRSSSSAERKARRRAAARGVSVRRGGRVRPRRSRRGGGFSSRPAAAREETAGDSRARTATTVRGSELAAREARAEAAFGGGGAAPQSGGGPKEDARRLPAGRGDARGVGPDGGGGDGGDREGCAPPPSSSPRGSGCRSGSGGRGSRRRRKTTAAEVSAS